MPSARLLKISLSALLPGVFASGCLVTFNDYPTGVLPGEAGASAVGSGGNTSIAGSEGKGGKGGGDTTGNLSLMLDDFEDGNVTLLPAADRAGSWYRVNDGQGIQLPSQNAGLVELLDPPRDSSERALHTAGSDFDVWGALVRADFNVQMGMAQAYDISAHSGVKLWARSGDERTYDMRVEIATPGADGYCIGCGDHFGTTVETTPDWQEFILPFTQMTQEGWGVPQLDEFELDEALGLQVRFGPGEDFDIWVDDVSFF